MSSIGRQAGRTRKPVGNTGGSMSFAGTTSSYLSVPNSADFRFGTGDFTIEWYMNNSGSQPWPRIFSMGALSTGNSTIAVSIEGGTFYFWIGGSSRLVGSVSVTGVWTHFAITRSGTSIRVFRNGVQLGSTIPSSYNFNDTVSPLTLGNEGSRTDNASYQGLLTNFHIVKGTALYTSNFTIPSTPRSPVANSVLLLNAVTSGTVTTDTSGTSKTVTNNSVTFSATPPS